MKTPACLLSVLVAVATLGASTPSFANARPKKETKGGRAYDRAAPSQAITAEIVDAIAEEMNRAITRLEIPGAPRPYHISFKITEVEVHNVASTLGSTSLARDRHFANLEARVRVGSYAFDNGNFVVPRAENVDATASINLPLEATPKLARRAAWLVTDSAYKEALVQLRAKTEARDAGALKRNVPSWEPSKPFVSEDQVLPPAMESLAEITERANRISGAFRGMTHLRDSRVAITSYLERRWYLNSEGTSATDTRRVSGVTMAALGRAPDGQDVPAYFVRYGETANDLPTDAELLATVKELSARVADLAKAPLAEAYTGPILFEGEAAAGVARLSLLPHLGGTPLPEGLGPQQAKRFGGGFVDKLGLRVFPTAMSVFDDPTPGFAKLARVIGGYLFDDEGVPSQRVTVAEGGVLKDLLRARTPAAPGQVSNGHARRVAPGGMFHGTATNTVIAAKGGLATAALRARLLGLVRDEGLRYGLVVRQLDDAAITGAPEYTRRDIISALQNADFDLPPPATLAYRVYPDGREELVRGVQLSGVPLRAWKDIVAFGKSSTTANFIVSPTSYLEHKLGGGEDNGFVPSSGIESSVTTPDLLFKELELVATKGGQRPAALVAPPKH